MRFKKRTVLGFLTFIRECICLVSPKQDFHIKWSCRIRSVVRMNGFFIGNWVLRSKWPLFFEKFILFFSRPTAVSHSVLGGKKELPTSFIITWQTLKDSRFAWAELIWYKHKSLTAWSAWHSSIPLTSSETPNHASLVGIINENRTATYSWYNQWAQHDRKPTVILCGVYIEAAKSDAWNVDYCF